MDTKAFPTEDGLSRRSLRYPMALDLFPLTIPIPDGNGSITLMPEVDFGLSDLNPPHLTKFLNVHQAGLPGPSIELTAQCNGLADLVAIPRTDRNSDGTITPNKDCAGK